MAKYRKKPIVIEAIQFINSSDIHEFCKDKVREPIGEDYLEIETLEGVMRANKWDWIVKGVKGEFYPCKPDVFKKTYEIVEASAEVHQTGVLDGWALYELTGRKIIKAIEK